jgi:hypothetical protein
MACCTLVTMEVQVESGSWPVISAICAAFQNSQTEPISGMFGIGTPFCAEARKPAMTGSSATCSATAVSAGMRGSASYSACCASSVAT